MKGIALLVSELPMLLFRTVVIVAKKMEAFLAYTDISSSSSRVSIDVQLRSCVGFGHLAANPEVFSRVPSFVQKTACGSVPPGCFEG
jgi:hypothetical protein